MRIDKNNPEFMKKYLKQAVIFEKQIYIWENALKTVDKKSAELKEEQSALVEEKSFAEERLSQVDVNVKKEIENSKYEVKRLSTSIKRIRIFRVCWWIIAILSAIFIISGEVPNPDFMPVQIVGFVLMGIAVVLAMGCLYLAFFDVGIIGDKKDLLREHSQKLHEETHIKEGNLRKQEINDEIVSISTFMQNSCQMINVTKINEEKIKSLLQDARKTLDDIYAMDVLPEKYRSLNAVATLYEYLENGICTTVMGHGGIYDTYEYHLRLGDILAKLDDILKKLDSIANIQSFLYQEVCECNKKLDKIDDDILSAKQAFDEYSAASLALQAQTNATVQYYAWKYS